MHFLCVAAHNRNVPHPVFELLPRGICHSPPSDFVVFYIVGEEVLVPSLQTPHRLLVFRHEGELEDGASNPDFRARFIVSG